MSRHDLTASAIFGVPVMLALFSLIGLVGALLEDGAWDIIGSVLLATTVAATVWALIRARLRSRN